jgi:hypothetical protein
MPMNFVKISGVIRRTPRIDECSPSERVRSTLQINESSKYPQMATILAIRAAADELMRFANGDRVVVRGHLSVSMKTDKLQIFVDKIRPAKSLREHMSCVHHMQIPTGGPIAHL